MRYDRKGEGFGAFWCLEYEYLLSALVIEWEIRVEGCLPTTLTEKERKKRKREKEEKKKEREQGGKRKSAF